jgi:hypothetical protein
VRLRRSAHVPYSITGMTVLQQFPTRLVATAGCNRSATEPWHR